MAKYSKTQDDLKLQLQQQIYLMSRNASSYDKGNEVEALQLATSIRVIVYDTGSSTSLLTHLGKKGIEFYDSAMSLKGQPITGYFGLLRWKMSMKDG